MKILLCGGGTAGHVNPALAIAQAIKKKKSDTEFLFVGREGGFENSAVKKAGIPLLTLNIKGIKRSLTPENLKRIRLAANCYREAKKIISDFSPDAVVGTGGYVSWPVIKAAQKLKVPTVIHESNASPGLTTRLLARGCDLLLLNYEKTAEHLPRVKNYAVVGNPLRADFTSVKRERARRELGLSDKDIYILSFGGSGGSETLNNVIISVMLDRIASTKSIKHLHATGKKYFEKFKNHKLAKGVGGCRAVPYIEDMPRQLSAADIVIARSGAMTISELALIGASAILIPSPNVTDNHQYKNAKLLADENACLLIEERYLTAELLSEKLELLINDSDARLQLSRKIKKFAARSAASDSADKILEITRR